MQLKVIEDAGPAPEPWYAGGLSFTCTQCGNCCTGAPGYVWVSDVEISRLADHLQITTAEVIDRYCRRIGSRYSLKERRSPQGLYDCTFLKEENGRRTCTIYPVRPLQCRTWPFWEGNLSGKDAWKSASRKCPGMDTGKKYTRRQVESLRDATDWPDKPPTSK